MNELNFSYKILKLLVVLKDSKWATILAKDLLDLKTIALEVEIPSKKKQKIFGNFDKNDFCHYLYYLYACASDVELSRLIKPCINKTQSLKFSAL